MSTKKDISREIIFSRIESLVKGRSISQFARDCDIKQPVMDAYIKRKRMPIAENLMKICIANEVTPNWVFGFSEEGLPPVSMQKTGQPTDCPDCRAKDATIDRQSRTIDRQSCTIERQENLIESLLIKKDSSLPSADSSDSGKVAAAV